MFKIRVSILRLKTKIKLKTLSHEETRRWSLWLENRRLEIPSVGGLNSSLPVDGGGAEAMITAIQLLVGSAERNAKVI